MNRNLSPQVAQGMFGGRKGRNVSYLQGNAALVSGTTYGGQGLGWFWQGYPNVISGLTEYDPKATIPGSNMDAVNPATSELARDAGQPAADITGYTQGGTNY